MPLIKVQSEGQRERVSHRQERVGFEVQNFIQERLLSDADATDYAIYPLVTEVIYLEMTDSLSDLM